MSTPPLTPPLHTGGARHPHLTAVALYWAACSPRLALLGACKRTLMFAEVCRTLMIVLGLPGLTQEVLVLLLVIQLL